MHPILLCSPGRTAGCWGASRAAFSSISCRVASIFPAPKHILLVKEKLAPRKVEIDLGVPRGEQRSPFVAPSHLVFELQEELTDKYRVYGRELNADKEKFTGIDFIFQISEVITN